jgi:hypothetical protein
MLASLFEARGWPCEFVGEDEISGEIKGSWASYTLRGVWRREDHVLQLLCLPDIRIPDDKRAAVFELLALVNEQLWVGHFDLWSNEDVVMFRHSLLLAGGAEPNGRQCESLLKVAIDGCDRYYQAFQFVLWAGKSPREAMEGAMFETIGEA